MWPETTTSTLGSSRARIGRIAPVKFSQPLGSGIAPEVFPPSWISTTIASAPSFLSLGIAALIVSRLVGKAQPAHTVGRNQAGGFTQGQADDADGDFGRAAAETLEPGRGEQAGAVCAQGAGGEILEQRPGELFDLARFAGGEFAQPPACLRSNSSVPLSNSWLPTALELQPDPVEHADRRLVEIDRGGELRGARSNRRPRR